MGDPTHDKVMWKRTVKQGFRTQGAPQAFSSIYPKTRICLFYCFMTFTNSSDINRGLTLTSFLWKKNQLRVIANKSLGHDRSVSIQTPLMALQFAWQVYPDSCSYAYDCSQPPNCERHGKPKNTDPFEELKTIRIVLLQDFIVEPMLAAKFPYLLSTVHLGVHQLTQLEFKKNKQ